MCFGLSNVLEAQIVEPQLKCFYIGYDMGMCRIDDFTDVLMDVIVDFAFGYHTGILKTYNRRLLKEAAKSIYGIKEYCDVKWTYVNNDSELNDDDIKAEDKILKRGEFGELILHTVLRDYFNSVPLLSKIYFKDSDGPTVHGFDCVHIGPDLTNNNKYSLFLGESKIYNRKDGTAGSKGITDLVGDIKAHFSRDFLIRECVIVSKKKDSFKQLQEYCDANTKTEYELFLEKKINWYGFLENVNAGKNKLEDLLNSVTVPLICTYQSDLFSGNKTDAHPDFEAEYKAEAESLFAKFTKELANAKREVNIPETSRINILLILLPIPSKKDLIKKLHQKLYNQQNA
jgi:Domain of unknown function (DUF1837).